MSGLTCSGAGLIALTVAGLAVKGYAVDAGTGTEELVRPGGGHAIPERCGVCAGHGGDGGVPAHNEFGHDRADDPLVPVPDLPSSAGDRGR